MSDEEFEPSSEDFDDSDEDQTYNPGEDAVVETDEQWEYEEEELEEEEEEHDDEHDDEYGAEERVRIGRVRGRPTSFIVEDDEDEDDERELVDRSKALAALQRQTKQKRSSLADKLRTLSGAKRRKVVSFQEFDVGENIFNQFRLKRLNEGESDSLFAHFRLKREREHAKKMKEGQEVVPPSPPSDDDVVLFGEESGDEEEGHLASKLEEASANGQSAQSMDVEQSAEPMDVEEDGSTTSVSKHAPQHAPTEEASQHDQGREGARDANITDSVMMHSGGDVPVPTEGAGDGDDDRDDARMDGEEGARGKSYVDECTIEELLGECKDLGNRLQARLQKHMTHDGGTYQPLIATQPEQLTKPLKGYQLVGLNWLYLLHQEGLNGILGDEMGLGKTVQSIALIAQLRPVKPVLIVTPTTTLFNWERELQVWCPSVRTLLYSGSVEEREEMRRTLLSDTPDVIICSYNIIRQARDRLFLRKRLQFSYLILDEAQTIKNVASSNHRFLAKFPAEYRLLLTGTPLQNNLAELWALLEFLMPDIFTRFRKNNPSMKEFYSLEESKERADDMKQMLEPFFLRRLKRDVAMGLPDKTHVTEYCHPTSVQEQLYAAAVAESREAVNAEGMRNALNVMMHLRKVVNHPCLVRSFYDESKVSEAAQALLASGENFGKPGCTLEEAKECLRSSNDFQIFEMIRAISSPPANLLLGRQELRDNCGKVLALLQLLSRLKQEKHRVLLFSQMTKVMDILEWVLEDAGHSYRRFDGGTKMQERVHLIDEFMRDQSIFIFMITTRAGGLGINLTAADTVIFYDSSFNPQVDRQAEDRCHRLGQEHAVTVYNLVTRGTVDEYIMKRSMQKTELGNIILEEDEQVPSGDGKEEVLGRSSGGPGESKLESIRAVLTQVLQTSGGVS